MLSDQTFPPLPAAGNRQQAQQVLAQSFAEALSGAGSGGNAQEAGRSAAMAAATAFAQSGGDNAVAIAFSQAIVTNGNAVAAAFSLAVAISIGDFTFRCAAAGLVCWWAKGLKLMWQAMQWFGGQRI